MGTLLEIGRHALEGVEVLVAMATTGLLGAGLIYSRHASGDGAPAEAERRD